MTEVLDKPLVHYPRWTATIYYRSEGGIVDVMHDIDELEDLQELVERGPHFGTIDRIDVRYVHAGKLVLTLEEAERL